MSGELADVRELIDQAVYEERDRIARDLHDVVIQRLFAIGLGIRTLDDPTALDRFVEDIDQTIRDIRSSIFVLRQHPGAALSLRGEILRVIAEAGASLRYEPTVRLEGPLDSVVPSEVHIELIATLHEALSNVVRHARARAVWVTVSVDRAASGVELLVIDDGVGIGPDARRRSGLANITTRAERLEGTCRVESPPEGGTRVAWTVPLRLAPSPRVAS